MIEDEYRRAVRPQVFLAGHLQVHADQCAGGVREQGKGKVLGLPPGPCQGEYRQPGHKRGHQAAGCGHGADVLADAGAAAAAEAGHRPAPLAGDLLQFAVRVECPRVADALQQQQVIGAVGVEKAPVKVGAGALRQVLGCVHLALAEAEGRYRFAREFSLAHFQVTAQHVLDAQVCGRRLHLVGSG